MVTRLNRITPLHHSFSAQRLHLVVHIPHCPVPTPCTKQGRGHPASTPAQACALLVSVDHPAANFTTGFLRATWHRAPARRARGGGTLYLAERDYLVAARSSLGSADERRGTRPRARRAVTASADSPRGPISGRQSEGGGNGAQKVVIPLRHRTAPEKPAAEAISMQPRSRPRGAVRKWGLMNL